MRGDFTFGEQIVDIADDMKNDWVEAKNGRMVPNKELVLRSKLRIETRQFHMRSLHRETWGDKQRVEVKSDFSALSLEERMKKAQELLGIIEDIKRGPPLPPPLKYRWQEAPDDEPQGGGIG